MQLYAIIHLDLYHLTSAPCLEPRVGGIGGSVRQRGRQPAEHEGHAASAQPGGALREHRELAGEVVGGAGHGAHREEEGGEGEERLKEGSGEERYVYI